MNEIKIFENKVFGDLRTVLIDSNPYFIGIDVTKALRYKNSRDALRRHCKGVVKHDILTDGGKQQMNCISESDLYRLVVNSELPGAEKFEKWVFEEVLPSIRKHGAYLTDKTIEEVLTDPDSIIRIASQLKEEREKRQHLEVENNKKDQIIGELKPRADYTDTILKNKGLVTITQIAKDYGISGQAMNNLLHSYGVQYKQSDQWLLYAEHQKKGYTHSETIEIVRSDNRKDVKMNTKWTQKGRLFLYELLKANGFYPMIESDERMNVNE